MREELTPDRLRALMREIARTAPRGGPYRVYLVGGGTAVHLRWRPSSVDADLFSEDESVFRDIQAIKERLQLNVELARPEDFVPALEGSEGRHVFVETVESVSFYHYDPYAQLLSKIVRGFARDVADAERFLQGGMVDGERFLRLVEAIPDASYARYPALSREAVLDAVHAFLSKSVG